ncbi:MAG: hemolysin family protein [Actinomycetales bacterium]|nr:hemolysin family protein [Actinomycetales bacterium]
MTSTLLFILAALCVLLAGVFVAGEKALARISKSSLDQDKRKTSRRGKLVLRMLEDKPKYVNVLTFVNLTLSTISIVLTAAGFLYLFDERPTALVLASLVMVIVGYLLLGVAAQTIGRQRALGVTLFLSRITVGLTAVLSPVTRLLILLGNAITPGKGFREGPFATQAELRELVDIAGADAVIEDDERAMIHSVFELGDTVAREVMVPRTEMVWIEQHKTLRQAMSLGLRSGYSRIPVIGESIDDIVGVIYVKDIAARVFEYQEAQNSERVSALMRSAFMVPDSRPVDELLSDMQAARTHLVILVDEYGGTAGLVTIEDVLEEIVGDISDEFDVGGPEIVELSSSEFRISSRLHVDDLAELIGEEITDEGVDTAAGLLAKRLGIVPIPGAHVRINDWILTAESLAGRRNRIGTLLVARDEFLGESQESANE